MADRIINGVRAYQDSAGFYQDFPFDPQVDALREQVAGKADASAIPQPATATPKSEMTGGALGGVPTRYAREDHQHPRLTSTTYVTLDASGKALVEFTRSFVNKPGLVPTETDADEMAQPIVLRGLTWRRDANGLYTGVTVQGLRSRTLPTLSALSGTLTLLTQVVTGVNSLIVTLTNFNVFATPASGASVSVIAIARSDVSAS